MNRIICFLFTALLLFLQETSIFSQTVSFNHYGIEHGLSQSQVQSILQDNDGNLWIGTLSGLTKYNGISFKSFSKKNGLAEDWVTCSYKDNKGDIWFGHWGGGVTRYLNKQKQFQNLLLEEYTRFKTITSVLEDGKGRYWISTEGAGIIVYDPQNEKMISLTEKDGLSDNIVNDLCKDDKGNIWMATERGITVYDPKFDLSSPSSFGRVNSQNGLSFQNITSIAYVNKNEIWMGTAGIGVLIIKLTDDFSSKYPEVPFAQGVEVISRANGLGGDVVTVLCEAEDGNVWVGSKGGGASKVSKSIFVQDASSYRPVKVYSTKQGLNYFNVNAIFNDREGNVWIGTDIGLNQYRGERFQLIDESDSLSNNIVWAVYADSKGNVWMGTNNGLSKLSYVMTSTGMKQRIVNYGSQSGLSFNIVISIHEDNAGNMWFGTAGGGVFKLTNEGRFENYNTAKGIAGNYIFSINHDSKGNLWFGTKEGASKLDVVTGQFRNYTHHDGLGGNNIYRIFRDSKENIWFASLGGVLSVYDGQTFKKYDESSGLNPHFIMSVAEDKKGRLWFGSYGRGLYMFNGKDFRNYSVNDGLSTDSPYSLLADDKDNIWIGNSRGIDILDPEKGTVRHYGKKEGFRGVEANPNAICKDGKGNIWIGTIMGAVKYDPAEDKRNTAEPFTFISGLKISTKDTVFPEDARFTYKQNHLTFKFHGVSLSDPEKISYKYKLEGFDKEWISLQGGMHAQEVVYSNIPPGSNYEFKVMACNDDGVCSSEAAVYKFFVSPPWYQTIIFYVFCAMLLAFMLFGADKLRTYNLKKANKILEDRIQERTLEIAQKNRELAARNKDITDSIRYAKRIQDAVLPQTKVFDKYLKESFVLFMPKDIVSGDFYWIEGRKSEEVLLAAADCTGHGVPGAFMSIVSNNLLNQAVGQNNILDPGKILDDVNKGIRQNLKKASDDQRISDGMDIALCAINFKTLKLKYAGAFNPLYLVRNNDFTEVKGERILIGNLSDGNADSFTTHEIQLQKGDCIYIFSDGYADQFGGDNGKKLKTSGFKNLILSMNSKPMKQQKDILISEFEKWRGNMEQVDDVLVIGIRV